MILQKDNSLLNKEKSDGYTALHLAACMDHHAVAQYLLDQVGFFKGFWKVHNHLSCNVNAGLGDELT